MVRPHTIVLPLVLELRSATISQFSSQEMGSGLWRCASSLERHHQRCVQKINADNEQQPAAVCVSSCALPCIFLRSSPPSQVENLWTASTFFVALTLCTFTKLDHNVGCDLLWLFEALATTRHSLVSWIHYFHWLLNRMILQLWLNKLNT